MPLEIDLNMPVEVLDNTITIDSEVIDNTIPIASEINENIACTTAISEAEDDPNDEGGDNENSEIEVSDEGIAISEVEHDPNDEGFEEEDIEAKEGIVIVCCFYSYYVLCHF
jgi:hypothetical protein